MARRRDNMLEALQQSRDEDRRRREEALARVEALAQAQARAERQALLGERTEADGAELPSGAGPFDRGVETGIGGSATPAQVPLAVPPSAVDPQRVATAPAGPPEARSPLPPGTRPLGAPSAEPGPAADPLVAPVPEPEEAVVLPVRPLVFGAVSLLLLGLAFVLGWLAAHPADETLAAGPGDPGAAERGGVPRLDAGPEPVRTTPAPREPEADPAQGTRQVTVGSGPDLNDLRFTYTVQVVQYPDTPRNQGLARAAHRILVEAGFPAVDPVSRRGQLFLLVGAGTAYSDLEALETELRAFEDPRNGRPMFQKPYRVRIDSVLR